MQMLVYAAVALVAALLGGFAGMLYQDARHHRRRHHRSSAGKPETAGLPVADESASQQAELDVLRRERDDLRRENTELQHMLRKEAANTTPPRKNKQRKATAPPAAVAPAPAVAATPAPDEPTVPDPASPTSGVRYASAVPGGCLDDAQLVEQSMSRMPLAVTISPTEPARASFTLSPGVDQSWLIEAGLDRLRDYFDYTLPSTWPSSVTATRPGQLVREAGGWRVHPNHKGQLEVR